MTWPSRWCWKFPQRDLSEQVSELNSLCQRLRRGKRQFQNLECIESEFLKYTFIICCMKSWTLTPSCHAIIYYYSLFHKTIYKIYYSVKCPAAAIWIFVLWIWVFHKMKRLHFKKCIKPDSHINTAKIMNNLFMFYL